MEMETTTTTKTYIPYDILMRILPQLPTNSIVRFRWACKYWFDLITRDTSFTKMQFHHSLFSSYPSVLISNFTTGTYIHELLQCHITDTKRYLSRPVKILDPFESSTGFHLLGTCHGLLLFSSTYHLSFCIWNPCTKEYKLLPPPPPSPIIVNQYCIKDEKHIYGVGYDSSIDDYKVIRNSYFYVERYIGHPSPIASSVQVYRLGTDTWTSIGHNPYNLLPLNYEKCGMRVNGSVHEEDSITEKYYDYGVFVNEALYWIDSSDAYAKIISFDISKETYQELSKQPDCFHGNLRGIKLQLFEGSLCLVLNIFGNAYKLFVEMWVMKDYGVNNNIIKEPSWTKLFKVIVNSYDGLIKPLRFTNSGEIMSLKSGRDFVLCDPKKTEITTLNSILYKGSNYNYASIEAVYNESLVSLNSGYYVGQEQEQKQKSKRRKKGFYTRVMKDNCTVKCE